MRSVAPLLLGVGALGLVFLASKTADAEADYDADLDLAEPVLPRTGQVMGPIAEGNANDPEIADLHRQIDDYFRQLGVDDLATAEMVTFLPKATEIDYAIPPPEYWQNMAYTLEVLRRTGLDLKNDVEIRGYRPPWYNKAVGGASGSTHQWFSAIDLLPRRVGVRRLHDEARKLWRNHRNEDDLGVGMYRGNIHVDARRGRPAKWGSKKDLL